MVSNDLFLSHAFIFPSKIEETHMLALGIFHLRDQNHCKLGLGVTCDVMENVSAGQRGQDGCFL